MELRDFQSLNQNLDGWIANSGGRKRLFLGSFVCFIFFGEQAEWRQVGMGWF
jgi:hypothetical protein